MPTEAPQQFDLSSQTTPVSQELLNIFFLRNISSCLQLFEGTRQSKMAVHLVGFRKDFILSYIMFNAGLWSLVGNHLALIEMSGIWGSSCPFIILLAAVLLLKINTAQKATVGIVQWVSTTFSS